MDILFIGGTGQISLPVVEHAAALGHKIFLLNRGVSSVPVPAGVETIIGDMDAETPYTEIGERRFDVVVQFRAFTPEQIARDLKAFAGRCGQYVFISSASVYEKPVRVPVITEQTPAINPYWPYSQQKIACEEMIRRSDLPWTIVRPSHTVRTSLPSQVGEGDRMAQRMIAGKPVIVAGDGSSLWTLTRSVDLAAPLVGLFGKAQAIGQTFHITQHIFGYNWNQIHEAIAGALGIQADIVHVPTDTLIKYQPDWIGPLLGDKSWTALFDNSKVMAVAGDFKTERDLDTVLADSIAHFKLRNAASPYVPDETDALLDRIIAEQRALGG